MVSKTKLQGNAKNNALRTRLIISNSQPSRSKLARLGPNPKTAKDENMPNHHSHDHGHGHGHGHSHDAHDHSHDLEPALQSNLYSKIAFDDITTLNESTPASGAAIVKKEWSQRLDDNITLDSDADEQLLMHIPLLPSPPILMNYFPNKVTASPAQSNSTAFSSAPQPALPPHAH